MPQTKTQKQKILEDLNEKIAKQKIMIFVDFTGLRVKDFSALRKKIKITSDEIKVAKKTLMGLALKKAKIEVETEKLPGEIALVFGYKDELLPAKTIYQFAETNKNLKILGGYLENKIRTAEEIITLAKLSSREELLARLVGSIKAPVSGFVNVLNGNLRNLVYILSKIKVAQ